MPVSLVVPEKLPWKNGVTKKMKMKKNMNKLAFSASY